MGSTVAELIERGFRLSDLDALVEELGLEGMESSQILDLWEQWAETWLKDEREKLSALKFVRAALQRRKDYLLEEIARMAARAETAERQRLRVEEMAKKLLEAERMLAGGEGKFTAELADGGKATLYSRTTSSVDDYNVDAIPDSLVRIRREANKTAIAAAIKAGTIVPGARVVTTTKDHVKWT